MFPFCEGRGDVVCRIAGENSCGYGPLMQLDLANSSPLSPGGFFGAPEDRFDRLVSAAAGQIAEYGAAAATARSVAARAGAAASAVNYNFGSIEQLFSAAFDRGVAETAQWLDGRGREVTALPRTADGAVLALEHLVAEWTVGARPLALLYQECLAQTPGRGPGADWTRLWRDFWLRTASSFGLGEADGRLLHLFFESEALYHLSTWSPALERAALREMCGLFGSVWLGAGPVAVTGALQLAERTAGVRATPIPPTAERIAEAAAAVVEKSGLGGLTHRAVAARAGVTTGAVTHHFRTVENLVAGMVRGQVLAMSRDAADGAGAQPIADMETSAQFFEAVRLHAVGDEPIGPAVRRRHLFLAALRRDELVAPAAVIRFAHGGTARDALDRFFHIPADQLSLYAGVLSRLLTALWFACAPDVAPRRSREGLLADIEARLERNLQAGVTPSPHRS